MTNYIKNLRIVYFMTLISPLALIGVSYLTIAEGTVMLNGSIDEIFKYMIPIFGLIFIPIGFMLFKKRLMIIVENANLDSKLQLYRGIVVQRIAFIEGVAIFSAVAFLITLNNLYVAYTIIALAFYLPIYPTLDKIKNDLALETDSVDLNTHDQKNKSFWGKNPWLIILLILVMILLNYNSFKEFFANKIVLPNVQVDNGVINDSIYHNDYLDWTFKIPKGFTVISDDKIVKLGSRGNAMFGLSGRDYTVQLLNLTNGKTRFTSNLEPRVLYPEITSEEEYINVIDKQFENIKDKSITIEKRKESNLKIDNLDFKIAEYIIKNKTKVGFLCLTRFSKDYILLITVAYSDDNECVSLLRELMKSDFNWK